MKLNMEFKVDGDSSDDDDEIHISSADSDNESIDDNSSVSDSEEEEMNNAAASTSGQNEAGPSSAGGSKEDEEEEEEDEVIRSILRSKDLHRNHPPTITLDDALSDICFHPNKDIIALASITGDVFIYKYNNDACERVQTVELHRNACRDIEFSEDGQILYSAGKDKDILLTDMEKDELKRAYFNAHDNPIYCLSLIDENTFATGDDEGVVKYWDIRQKGMSPIFTLKEMDDYVSSIITNDESKYLVCTSGDGTLTTFNIGARKLHCRTEDYPQDFTCLGLFKHGRKILVGGSKGNLFLFNWGEFGLHTDEIRSLTKQSINCMIPITETIVITGGEDKMLRATSLFPNRQLGIVGQHDLSVECLDISSDGSVIASYSYDNTVKFWNVSYFETLNVTEAVVKGGKQKQMKHNLPSSKVDNASDFFSDL